MPRGGGGRDQRTYLRAQRRLPQRLCRVVAASILFEQLYSALILSKIGDPRDQQIPSLDVLVVQIVLKAP